MIGARSLRQSDLEAVRPALLAPRRDERAFAAFAKSQQKYLSRLVDWFWANTERLWQRVGSRRQIPLDREDLAQIALIALWQAVESYEWRCERCGTKSQTATEHAEHGRTAHGRVEAPRPTLQVYAHGRAGRAVDHTMRRYWRRAKFQGAMPEFHEEARAKRGLTSMNAPEASAELALLVARARRELGDGKAAEIFSTLLAERPEARKATAALRRLYAPRKKGARVLDNGLIPETIAQSALALGLDDAGAPEIVRERVESFYAVERSDALFEVCNQCGTSAPNDIRCPGCGNKRTKMAKKDKEPEAKEAKVPTAKVLAIAPSATAKAAKQEEDADDRLAVQKSAEKETSAKAAKKLTDLEKKIRELKSSAGCLEWDIGKYLLEIRKGDLWQAANKGHESFNSYVLEEFEFTRQTATSYMKICECFSREEASTIPLGHLRLLVGVPNEADRNELAEKTRKEAPTFRELASMVKTKRAEAGLNTARAGHEDMHHVSVRLKIGVVAEGIWKEGRAKSGAPPKRLGSFQLGDNTFLIEDLGKDGFVVKLAPPAASSSAA